MHTAALGTGHLFQLPLNLIELVLAIFLLQMFFFNQQKEAQKSSLNTSLSIQKSWKMYYALLSQLGMWHTYIYLFKILALRL